MNARPSLLILILLALPLLVSGQNNRKTDREKRAAAVPNLEYDSNYYVSYESLITSRFYFSKKYTSLRFRNVTENYSFTYRPNTTLNMGVGATYRWFTLNLAYGFGFLNPDRGEGKTKYLDLQFHSYGRKVVVDAFGQFYNGFYLTDNSIKTGDNYYQRPDLRVREVGLSGQYIFNNRRFTYRGAFFQNEWQKKSAGTLTAGFEVYYGIIDADSSIVPRAIDETLAAANIDGARFFEIGPNAGYAYTLVIKKHFYITASASLSFTYGANTMYAADGDIHSSKFSPNYFVRGFTGYNSETWAVSFTYVTGGVSLSTNDIDRRVFLNTGNFRLNFVRRFTPGPKTKRYLKIIDNGLF